MIANKNYSIHDDITGRLTFFVITAIAMTIALKYFPPENSKYLFAMAGIGAVLFWAIRFLPATPFSRDIKELLLAYAATNLSFAIVYLLPNGWYNEVGQYGVLLKRVLNTLILLRLIWPCRDKNLDFVGWPTFGFIGLITKLRGLQVDLPTPSKQQAYAAYGTIMMGILAGVAFYKYDITNTTVTGDVVVFVAALFAVRKSLNAHTARLAAQAAKQQAEQAQLAGERAEAARVAQVQMQNNLDAQLLADAERNRAETKDEELARLKLEKAAAEAKLAELQALHTPEAQRTVAALMALPEETRLRQIKVIEALGQEVEYFDAEGH